MLSSRPANPIVVTHRSGVQFGVQIRSHEILVDQTLSGGGEDSAPTPIELLGAALGGCVAYYVDQYLRVRGLPREGLRVEVTQTTSPNPHRVEDFEVRVVVPDALPASHLRMIEKVVKTCPAHNTLERGAKVRVQVGVETPVMTTAG